ncbi:hypothetical protein CE91St49_38640 [Emergencia timonensis]|nr:hypothetical protein CE91St48_38740 [Emergencia timonensis]BDF14517.1 hypothetical protein CE91St49_38640 [Emergencia timonensis]
MLQYIITKYSVNYEGQVIGFEKKPKDNDWCTDCSFDADNVLWFCCRRCESGT